MILVTAVKYVIGCAEIVVVGAEPDVPDEDAEEEEEEEEEGEGNEDGANDDTDDEVMG